MTECMRGAIYVVSGLISVPIAIFLANRVKRMFELFSESSAHLGEKIRSFNPFRPFSLIPVPVYAGAVMIALAFGVYHYTPSGDQIKPCGPTGQAVISTASKIVAAMPTSFVSVAAAATLSECGCEKQAALGPNPDQP